MEYRTISEVSRDFQISTRTLRYYDKIGLLPSQKKEDYAYRVYDEASIRRLQQIIVLRKLRISLNEIKEIFEDEEQTKTVQVFQQNISNLSKEISALTAVRSVMEAFLFQLKEGTSACRNLETLQDSELAEAVEALRLSANNLKEEWLVEKQDKISETLNQLKDVRILMLPPCTVASYHVSGENPEEAAGEVVSEWIKSSGLYQRKPDARMFGFNHPNPSPDKPHHGYEVWVTIPDDMELPKPLVKKHFEGGMFAAHTIQFPNFHEWDWLIQWAKNNPKFMVNFSEQGDEIMGGCLEEHINWVYCSHLGWPDERPADCGQIDLLLPVKPR